MRTVGSEERRCKDNNQPPSPLLSDQPALGAGPAALPPGRRSGLVGARILVMPRALTGDSHQDSPARCWPAMPEEMALARSPSTADPCRRGCRPPRSSRSAPDLSVAWFVGVTTTRRPGERQWPPSGPPCRRIRSTTAAENTQIVRPLQHGLQDGQGVSPATGVWADSTDQQSRARPPVQPMFSTRTPLHATGTPGK